MGLSTRVLLVFAVVGYFTGCSTVGGIIFIEEGSTLNFDDVWLLSFGLNMDEYIKPLNRLRAEAEYFEKAFQSLSELDRIDVNFSLTERQARQTLLELFEKKSADFYHQHGHVMYLFKAAEKILLEATKKSISNHTFFNLSNESSIKTIASYIHQGKKMDVFYSNLSVIENHYLEVNDSNDSINSIANATSAFKTSMSRFYNELSHYINSETDFVDVSLQIRDMFELVSGVLYHAVYSLDEIINLINESVHGSLSDSLISPLGLYKILQRIQPQLPPGFGLPFQLIHENIPKYYESSRVMPVKDGNQLRFVVFIPIINANSHFDIFRAMTAPTEVKGRFNIYEVDTFRVAVSFDRSRYAIPSLQVTSGCKSTGVCRLEVPIHETINFPVCSMYLYLKEEIQVMNHCSSAAYNQSSEEYLYQNQAQTVYSALVTVISWAIFVIVTLIVVLVALTCKRRQPHLESNQNSRNNETQASLFRPVFMQESDFTE